MSSIQSLVFALLITPSDDLCHLCNSYANSDGELSAAGRAVLSLQGTPLYASAASSPAPAPHSPVNEEVEEGLLLCMQLLRLVITCRGVLNPGSHAASVTADQNGIPQL